MDNQRPISLKQEQFLRAVDPRVTYVLFTITNTAASPTLNISGTGAKPIYLNNAAASAALLAANRVIQMVYDGTQYEIVYSYDSNTTYSAMSVAEGTTGTATSTRGVRADYLKQIINYYVTSASNSKPRTWIDSSLGFKKRQLIYQSAALGPQTTVAQSRPTWGNTANGLHLCGWMTGTAANHLVIYDMTVPSNPIEIEVPTTTGQIYGCAYSRDGSTLAICESTTPWVEFFDTSTIPYTKIGDGVQNGYLTAAAGAPAWSMYSSDPKRFYCISSTKLHRFGTVPGSTSPTAFNAATQVSNVSYSSGLCCELSASTVVVANNVSSGSSYLYMLAFASDTDLDGIPQITNVISPTSYYDSIRSFRSGELVKCDQVNGIIFNRPDAPPEAINSYYSGTYRYPDAAGTTMGGELAVPHMAALASGNSGIIEYADTSNTTVAVDNYTTLSGLAYTATYGLEFSPDGKMLAFFHNRMSFGGGSSIMSLLYV